MTAAELLHRLNQLDEGSRIEAKLGSEVGRSILETVCAFANEPGLGGGWLLLGVSREFPGQPKSRYVVVGVASPDKLNNDLSSQCATVFNYPLRVEITTELIEGHTVMVIFVPEMPPDQKPLYFQARGLPQGALRRIGSTDQRCSEEDLITFYQARRSRSFDASVLHECDMEDIATEAIFDYRRERGEANPTAEELRWSDHDLLHALKAIARDANGVWRPTVSGLLLFGSPQALRREMPLCARIDYIRVQGTQWVADPDRRFDSLDIRAPMLTALRRCLAAILDDLPKRFSLKEGALQRSETPLVPERALREALVNTVMHRNYRVHSPVQVIRFSDRIEIRNAGYSLKPTEELGTPGSVLRNPTLAAVLHDTRFAESKGSGIRTIREILEELHSPPPTFYSDRSADLFVATFALEEETDAAPEGPRSKPEMGELVKIEGKPYPQNGKLGQIGDKFVKIGGKPQPQAYPQNGKSGQIGDKFVKIGGKPQPQAYPQNGTLEKEALKRFLAQFPEDLAAELMQVSSYTRRKQFRDLIEKLCQHRAWTISELALTLRRQPKTIRNNYLPVLLEEGRLEMTFPESPNSPKQTYRARVRESE